MVRMKRLRRTGFWLALGSLVGCAALPAEYPRPESYTLTDTADTRLGRASAPLAVTHPRESGLRPLASGIDAFVARLVLADVAERSLDVQYYIWHDDVTGRWLAERLVRAADRGVRVRVLLDDIGTAPDDFALLVLELHPNIEVRLFNPVATRDARGLGTLADFERLNRRMHNKSFTADNQATVIGGRNVGDEYFAARPDLEFGDLDVLGVGPVVHEVSTAFDRYWNSRAAFPITALTDRRATGEQLEQGRAVLRTHAEAQRDTAYARALESSALAQALRAGNVPFFWGRARLVYDDPEKVMSDHGAGATPLESGIAPVVDTTRSDLLLVSPYFVPGKAGVQWLRGVRERGVRVRVVTNSLAASDVAAVHSGYQRYRRSLLDAGVELYEFKPTAGARDREGQRAAHAATGLTGSSRAALHAKTFIFDRRVVFVGSLNLDPRSVHLNTEIGVLFDSPELARGMAEAIDDALPHQAYHVVLADVGTPDARLAWVSAEDGGEVRYDSEPEASLWRRLGVWFLSLLPIESQL
jgi:putative cardiolipin synthase